MEYYNTMLKKIIFLILTMNSLFATGAWMMNGRVHPELEWKTIESDHFNIHYHNGIEHIAHQGASIAEQVRPTLMEQVGLDTLPRIDIVFTAEDEIMNGFAMPSNHTVIWVDQNEVAVWTEDEKWLRTVLAHELQHIAFFNVTKTWLPKGMDMLFSGIPGWIVEGLAEYYTERWRPYRYDMSHMSHVIKGSVHKIKDPHNDGFSKTLYLADRFGDSTIVNILNHRNKLGLLFFEESFKKHTGISLKQFTEDWRRQMNTYFFGVRSQKEAIQEVGNIHSLPGKRVFGFDYFSDSLKIALVGQKAKGQGDISLMIAKRDTSEENKKKEKALKKVEKKDEKPKKIKPIWEIDEFDFGRIHSYLDISPDDKTIIYSKWRFGENQSLVWDILSVDVEKKETKKLTSSMRASFPVWHPSGEKICFVAHEASTSNLFTMNPDGSDIKQITHYTDDDQIISPSWSPDGSQIAYAQSGPDGNVDIHILTVDSGDEFLITDRQDVDHLPIWHPDGSKITYTSHAGGTPNIYTYDLETKTEIQNTDVGEAVWSTSWNRDKTAITAITLPNSDSVRVVEISPERVVEPISLNIRDTYSSWKTKSPDHPIINVNPNKKVPLTKPKKYGFYRHINLLQAFIFPDDKSLSTLGIWTDATGRHTMSGIFYTDYDITSTLIQYQNAEHSIFRGFWGFNFYDNINYTWRPYDESQTGLTEVFDGWTLWGRIPYNFGNNISSNHSIYWGLQLLDRTAFTPTNIENETEIIYSNNGLPKPESGKEGTIYLKYSWLSRRPQFGQFTSPRNGHGMFVSYFRSDERMWGNFTYDILSLDIFKNIPVGPLVLYGRLKGEMLNGENYPAQETLGLTNDNNLYIMGKSTPWKENLNLRGLDQLRLGDRAYLGTIELRTPGIEKNIVQALGFQLSDLSLALISDFGNAWNSNADEKEKMIITSGYELRAAFKFMNLPLLVFGYGQAQELEEWANGNYNPETYFRLTLINPF